ncbi:proteoglycan 4-like [Drosophila montana]|uniref:proteoglycan 4-like n=1 Tax=Drosophila montana TaxID=40370 RepID=UPI00313AC172
MALTQKSGSKQFVKNVMVMKKDTCSVRELLNWVNAEMQCDVKELSELKTGGVYCQFVHKLFPAELSLTKVYMYTNASYEIEANFKLLRNTFAKLNIRKDVPYRELAKGRGHYEFLNWLHKFHKMNHNGRPYDAFKERRGKPIGLKRIVEAERRFDYAAYLRRSSTIVASVYPRKPVELVPRAHSLLGISERPDNLVPLKLNPPPDKSKAKAKAFQSAAVRRAAQPEAVGKSVKPSCEDRSDESLQSTPESLPSVPLKQVYHKRIESPAREAEDPESSNPEPHPAVPSTKRLSYKRSHSTAKRVPPEPIQAGSESLYSTPERISAVPSKRASYKRNQSPSREISAEPIDAWFELLESPLKRVDYKRIESPDPSIYPEPLEPDPESISKQTNYKQKRSTTDIASQAGYESTLEPSVLSKRVGHKPKPSTTRGIALEPVHAWLEPLETTAEHLSFMPSTRAAGYKKNRSPAEPTPESVPAAVSKRINYKCRNHKRTQSPVQEIVPEPFESCCQLCELTPESVPRVPSRRVNYKRVQSPAKAVAPEPAAVGYEPDREIPPEPKPELLKRVKHKSIRSATREKAPESLQAWFEPLESTPKQLSSVPLRSVNYNRERAPEPTQASYKPHAPSSESAPAPTSRRVNYKRVQSPAKTVPSETPEARYEPAREIAPEPRYEPVSTPDPHPASVPLKRVKDKRIQSAAKVAQKTSQTDQEHLQPEPEPLSTVASRRLVPERFQSEPEPLSAVQSRRVSSKPTQEVAPKIPQASYEPRQTESDRPSVRKSVKPICELAGLTTEPVEPAPAQPLHLEESVQSTLEPLKRVNYKSIVPEPLEACRKPVEPAPKPISAVPSKRVIVKRIQSTAKTDPAELPQAGYERMLSTPEPHPAQPTQRLHSKPISSISREIGPKSSEAGHEPLQVERIPLPDAPTPSSSREIAAELPHSYFEPLPDPLSQRAKIKPTPSTSREIGNRKSSQADDEHLQWEAEPLPDPPEQRVSNKSIPSTSSEIGRKPLQADQGTLRSDPKPLPDPATSRNKDPESSAANQDTLQSDPEPPLADPPSDPIQHPTPPASREILPESSQADEGSLQSKPDSSIDRPRPLTLSSAVLKVGQSVVRAYCEESGCVALPSDSDSEDEKDDHIWDVRRQIVLLRDKLTTIETILLKYSASSRQSVKKLKRYLRKQQVDEPFVLGNF